MKVTRAMAIGAMAAVMAGTGIVSGASAADDPAKVIGYRQAVMKGLAAHITAVAMVAKGEVSYAGHVAGHAQSMAALAKLIPEVFPAGSEKAEGVETEAKPEVWKEWDKFAAAAKTLEEQSAKLAEVAAGGDVAAIGAQLGEVGKACGGCHDPFRVKKAE